MGFNIKFKKKKISYAENSIIDEQMALYIVKRHLTFHTVTYFQCVFSIFFFSSNQSEDLITKIVFQLNWSQKNCGKCLEQ